MRKKHIFTLILTLCAAVAVGFLTVHPVAADTLECSVLPDQFCSAANGPSGSGQANSSNSGIFMFLQWVLAILTGGVGIVAIGAFVWAGILYSSASGNAEQVNKAKGMMTQTVIGLVVFGAIALALTWLIPGGIF